MILFDIDDTLFNNTDAEIKAAKRFYEQNNGLDHFAGIDDFVQQWRTSTETYLQMFIDGRVPFQEQRRRRLRDIFREPFSDQAADALFEQYLQLYEDSWALFPDVHPCLDRLAPLSLGIITNGNSEQQRQKLKDLCIIDCFDIIIVSEEVGTAKPDPRIFEHACKTAQKEPSSCFYVGDKLETDALAASAAGLNGIWLNRNHPKSEPKRIREIDTLYALQGDNFS